jgi:hypothetical protein
MRGNAVARAAKPGATRPRRATASRPLITRPRRAAATRRPTLVLPGIQGSSLENFYPLDPATTWSALRVLESRFVVPDFDALALDGPADADLATDVVMRASALLAAAYGPLVAGLRGRRNVPTYLFPYDWRYSNVAVARALVRYVQQLQRKPIDGWDGVFDVVAHSMGGLALRAFLAEWGAATTDPLPIGRVVFIATPHLGSLDAVEALISGEAALFGGRKEMRKLLRTFPSVYELLPRFDDAVVRGGAPLDIFDVHNWQNNVTAAREGPDDYGVLQSHLTSARNLLTALPQAQDVLPAERLLVIYGNNADSTAVQVKVGSPQGKPPNWYDFDHKLKGPGDDVVPVVSARLPGVAAVEIRSEDVSYFHPIQHGLAALDLHAFLPALDEVATIVGRFLDDKQEIDLLPAGLPRARFRR